MPITNSQTIENINLTDLDGLNSKQLLRNFGQPNDSIQLSVYDGGRSPLFVDRKFTDYTAYHNPPLPGQSSPPIVSIDIDYEQVLRDYGYTTGNYIMNFSFQRAIFENSMTIGRDFYVTEISPSRREIKVNSENITQLDLHYEINELGNILNSSPFIKDINAGFRDGPTLLILNARATQDGGAVLKLYNPLPLSIGINSRFRIYEEIINPIEVTVSMPTPDVTTEVGIDIGAPNFSLKNENIFNIPSGQKTFDQILSNGSVSSSFNNVQNLLSGSGIEIDLEFDNIDTPSGYHFENFIHFSSATERLQNFKYKLGLLETYSSSLANLNNITGSVSSSTFVTENTRIYQEKQNKLIQGFDYYERYLYYESGTYAWPKTNSTLPYTNAKTDSGEAAVWFGASLEDYNNPYYGGQMLSASKFDDYNPYRLVNTIPPHITDNSQNEKYVLFVDMVGQHFDNIWAYIDSITDINEAHSGLKDGISKDLVLNQLTSRGISAYDQFSNSSLYEYLIGDDGTETFEYSPTDGSTLISASNAPIPKGDIAKEIWKRLYHNSSYLLKTKGTERGLKALIACYGIPETVLHVKEYGGPLVDKTGFRTFSYQKESKMVSNEGTYSDSQDFAVFKTNRLFDTNTWDSAAGTPKSIQIRYLPDNNFKTGTQTILTTGTNSTGKIAIQISQSINNNLYESGSFGHLLIVTGSSEDTLSNSKVVSSSLVPFFNGKPWNISVIFDHQNTENITAYATQTTFNKNTYIASCSLNASNYFSSVVGAISSETLFVLPIRKDKTFVGVSNDNEEVEYTGSIQELRIWREVLNESTIVSQSLSPFNYNGNTISSSYEGLLYRSPLGSNLELTSSGVGHLNIANTLNYAPNTASSKFVDNGTNYYPGKSVNIEETHHLTTPDTVGSGMVSDKIRIDNGTFDDNFLSPNISVETSPQDRQPLDYSDLGVFFSPTFEVNEDIIYTLGGFRLDDYIGDPKHYTSSSYPDLKTIRDIYTQKLNKKLGIGDYIRTIQFFDHSLFKMIKEFVPAKANLKTGLVIEPHYLERTKVAGTNIDYEQIIEHLASYSPSGSITSTNETVHDVFIDVVAYIESGSYSTAVENVAQKGRLSKKYYNSI